MVEKDENRYPEFGKRLVWLMNNAHINAAAVAEVLGVTSQIVYKYVAGTVMPRHDKMKKLAVLFGVSPAWLQWGEGISPSGDEFSGIEEAQAMFLAQQKKIPVVGTAQLGDNGFWADLQYPVGHGAGYILWSSKDPNAYAVECVGDSMKPRIQPHDFAVIEPNIEYSPGDEVLIRDKSDRVMIKKYLYSRDGKIHLFSINENHKPIEIETEMIEKIHKVGGIAPRSLHIPE